MTGTPGLFRMLVLSTILHLIFLSILSIPLKKTSKRIEFPSIYTVKLVPGIEVAKEERLETSTVAGETGKTLREKAPLKPKNRVSSVTRDTGRERSLSVKKSYEASTTSEEVSALETRIRELRKQKFDVFDRSPERSIAIPGSSTSSAIEGELQAYVAEIWKRVRNSWGLPGGLSVRRDLETVVSVKIRKDGRIIAIDWEKKSGNRLYDESVLRTLRSVDPFPPFPQSIPYESIEIGFRFLPGELL